MSWPGSMRATLRDHAATWITPDWPAPERVRAFVTTRAGGVSEGAYASLNLGARSGDDALHVARNREIVATHLPRMPRWLAQVHGIDVADLDAEPIPGAPIADAAISRSAGTVCAVLTADCMPLLLCEQDGRCIGIAHAGWRGMAAGVIERTVAALGCAPVRVMAWMGPTIGPSAFEVGPEVREVFLASDPGAGEAFAVHKPGKYFADLYDLARRRLASAGVTEIHGGEFCTHTEVDRFFSYRREPRSGRMGAFIWLE